MCARFVSRGAPFHAFHNTTHKLLLVVVFAVVPWVFFGPFFSKESLLDFIVQAFFCLLFCPFLFLSSSVLAKKKRKKKRNGKKKRFADF